MNVSNPAVTKPIFKMDGAALLTETIQNVRDGMNQQLKTLADNFNEQMNLVQTNCRRWWEQLKGFVDTNTTDIGVLKNTQQTVVQENRLLRERIEKLEADAEYKTDHAFRLQLIAYNIPEIEDENPFATIRWFFVNKLKIPQERVNYIAMRDCHRLGKRTPGKTRPMVVAFLMQPDRDSVLLQAKELRGTNLSLQPHLSKKQLEVKKALLAKRSLLKERDERILAFIAYRMYKPILLIKIDNRLQEFKDGMNPNQLQFSDRPPPRRPSHNNMDDPAANQTNMDQNNENVA